MAAQIEAQDGGDAMHKKRNRDAVHKKCGGLKSLGRRLRESGGIITTICSSSKKRAAAAAMQRNSYASMTDNKFVDSHGSDELKDRVVQIWIDAAKENDTKKEKPKDN